MAVRASAWRFWTRSSVGPKSGEHWALCFRKIFWILETSFEIEVMPFSPADRTLALGLKQTIRCGLLESWVPPWTMFRHNFGRMDINRGATLQIFHQGKLTRNWTAWLWISEDTYTPVVQLVQESPDCRRSNRWQSAKKCSSAQPSNSKWRDLACMPKGIIRLRTNEILNSLNSDQPRLSYTFKLW